MSTDKLAYFLGLNSEQRLIALAYLWDALLYVKPTTQTEEEWWQSLTTTVMRLSTKPSGI